MPLVLISLAVIILDRVTKILVQSHLAEGESIPVVPGVSMLANFFDIRKNSKEIFEGLEICDHQTLCSEWMNQYPTLFISFKDVDGLNFQSAMKMLRNQISWICNEHDYLSDSDKVNENDKKIFLKLQDISEENLSEHQSDFGRPEESESQHKELV